jgi:peptidoglycan hydrolase-like protein with peptidoglycan-binding domain
MIVFLLGFGPVRGGDEALAEAQRALKAEGFYFGEADGVSNEDTVGAIKRFQMRSGLEATGVLDEATRARLASGEQGISENADAAEEVAEEPAPGGTAPGAGGIVKRGEASAEEQADEAFLKGGAKGPAASPAPPPGKAPLQPFLDGNEPPQRTTPLRGLGEFGRLFARTPFERAPLEVQRATVRVAQRALAGSGDYEGEADGLPSAALREGVARYQGRKGLPVTGRLDATTLDAMRLMPGQEQSPFGRSAGPPR